MCCLETLFTLTPTVGVGENVSDFKRYCGFSGFLSEDEISAL